MTMLKIILIQINLRFHFLKIIMPILEVYRSEYFHVWSSHIFRVLTAHLLSDCMRSATYCNGLHPNV